MTYSATIEPLCEHALVVRLHEKEHAQLGDPYVWCASIKIHEDGCVEFKGVDKRLPYGGPGAICAALREAGFRGRIHERHADGAVRAVMKTLNPCPTIEPLPEENPMAAQSSKDQVLSKFQDNAKKHGVDGKKHEARISKEASQGTVADILKMIDQMQKDPSKAAQAARDGDDILKAALTGMLSVAHVAQDAAKTAGQPASDFLTRFVAANEGVLAGK